MNNYASGTTYGCLFSGPFTGPKTTRKNFEERGCLNLVLSLSSFAKCML
jgi:hypothetical protein